MIQLLQYKKADNEGRNGEVIFTNNFEDGSAKY